MKRKKRRLMKIKGHTPVRTCVSCGAKRRKKDLIKLAIDHENRLIRNDQGRLEGRGAYVCDTPLCLKRLLNNKRLNRLFRTDSDIDISRELLGIPPFGDREPAR